MKGIVTHDRIIDTGLRFLKHQGFWMWLAEPPAACSEKPDIIAWKSGLSLLIECKATRADFLRDLRKPFRNDGNGMGNFRFYLAPENIINPEELPPFWGFIEVVDDNEVRVVRNAYRQDCGNPEGEKTLMYSWAYRMHRGMRDEIPSAGRRFRVSIDGITNPYTEIVSDRTKHPYLFVG